MKNNLFFKAIVGYTFVALLVVGCKERRQAATNFSLLSPSAIALNDETLSQFSVQVGSETIQKGKGCGHEELRDVQLPTTYTGRKFLTGITNTYDIFNIAGKIYYWDSASNTYKQASAVSFIKDNVWPKTEAITNGELYTMKLDCGSSLTGSAAVASLSVEGNKILEVTLQDVAKAFIPDTMVNEEALKAVRDGLSDADRGNYYFVNYVVLSAVNHRVLDKQKFKAGVSASWITVGGETYRTLENFSKERTISVDLVSLKDMIFSHPVPKPDS